MQAVLAVPSCHRRAGYDLPVLGLRDGAHQFLTPGQRRFVEALCLLTEHAIQSGKNGELGLDMDMTADAIKENVEPPPVYYTEQSQQNHYKCETYAGRDDILGTYGYC